MREKLQPSTWARVRTRRVLATPGTPSMSAWWPVKMAMRALSMTSIWPMITLATSCRAWTRTCLRRSVLVCMAGRREFETTSAHLAGHVIVNGGVSQWKFGMALAIWSGFPREDGAFANRTPTILADDAGLTNDAMTRNDVRQGVGSDSRANGARCGRFADRAGQASVAD